MRNMTIAALAVSASALAFAAQAQTPYYPNQPAQTDPYAAQAPYDPYGQQPQTQGQSPNAVIGAILGAIFGDRLGVSTTLESEWSRGRRPLYNRQAQFDQRLEADVRSGALSYNVAQRLRADYADLVQLEARYAADGRITNQERADLTARYRAFSQRVEDANDGGWTGGGDGSIAGGRYEFETRVDAAVRSGRLDRYEADRLRRDYQSLIETETYWARDGLSQREREELQTRLSDLNRRVGDGWNGGGGGYPADDRQRLIQIEQGIEAGGRAGWLNRTEAEHLRAQHGDLVRLEAAYARLNVGADERAYLDRRLSDLETRVRVRRW